MFLGVLLHAAIPYVTISVPFWPVQDARGHPAFDLFLFAVHDFRMQVFFLLAGFFGALLYARYGLGRTAWHRFKRIALPLVLGMATVQPATQAALIYAAASAYRDNPESAGRRDGVLAGHRRRRRRRPTRWSITSSAGGSWTSWFPPTCGSSGTW